MRNDQQSVNDFPLIIHGGDINHERWMEGYPHKVPVLIAFDKTKSDLSLKWESWFSYLFIDSGAFSVSMKTAEVKLATYIEFLHKNKEIISHYAALDDIFDGQKSLENWRLMRKEGLFPIPVYHEGEPWKIFEEYAEDCTYIGLGNVSQSSGKTRQIFFDKMFSKYPDRSKIGFHGFGVTQYYLLKRYPWRSVDSTTLSMACRNGLLWMPEHFGSIYISKQNRKKESWYSEENEKFLLGLFEKYGYNYNIAQKKGQRAKYERIFFSLDYLKEFVRIPDKFTPTMRFSPLVSR